MMKKVLIISDSKLCSDPRILVQIEALQDNYDLTCLGKVAPGGTYKGKFVEISRGGAIKRFLLKQKSSFYKWRRDYVKVARSNAKFVESIKKLKDSQFDVILCNDITSAPLAFMLQKYTGGKIYVDAHEFTPRQWEGNKGFEKKQPYLEYLTTEYAAKADWGTTVCQSIADFYQDDYGFKVNSVVMNLPKYNELSPSKVDPSHVRMVHHGVANPTRGLTNLIDIVKLLDDRFTLDLYLINKGAQAYNDLVEYAKSEPRVRFCDAVSTRELPKVLNDYDIGIYPLVPAVPNQEYALPNKFFEFMQARLAIAIWPSVEMKRLLDEHDLGVVSENYSVEELASLLNALSVEDIARFKENSHVAAQTYNANDSLEKIKRGVEHCLNR